MDTKPRRALAAGLTPGSGSGVERALSETGFEAVEWTPDAESVSPRTSCGANTMSSACAREVPIRLMAS